MGRNYRFVLVASFLMSVSCAALTTSSYSVNGLNGTIFKYHDISQCRRNEFYNLDYFACEACNSDDEYLQPTENKFACECIASAVTVALYDSNRERPICASYIERPCEQNDNESTSTTLTPNENNCNPNESSYEIGIGNDNYCQWKYVNRTKDNNHHNDDDDEVNHFSSGRNDEKRSSIRITRSKVSSNECQCDLKYNFRYRDYCIANDLLKPYLHYNSFWQPIKGGLIGHFNELKFIAFFCQRMRNITACNHLANLCIVSHYSVEKNSPCSAFLLTQASDVAFRFGTDMDDQLRPMRPFLYFKKGKQTAELIQQAVVNSSGYDLSSNNQIQLFSTHYALDGSFKRRGSFSLEHINFCGSNALDVLQKSIQFGKRFRTIKCSLSLENLIDMLGVEWRTDFLSLFLNYTSVTASRKVLMHAIPILIENLTPENQLNKPSEWLLLKRFRMISAQPRFHFGRLKPSYEDEHKLHLYKSLQFVSKFELTYKIHSQNHISIPILRLHYQSIEFHPNTSLEDIYPFTMDVTFTKYDDNDTRKPHEWFNETVLPMSIFIVVTISLLRAHNYRKRRRSTTIIGTADTPPQLVPMDFCDFHATLEFLIQLCSHLSHALLISCLLFVIYDAMQFLTQKTVTVTLPLIKRGDSSTLELLIYAALFLKLIFYCVNLWRCTHFDLFFIDWERPKCYDNNHFNLKSNLETSSVSSSVRTFVSENNVSAWRILFTANEWIRLSTKRKSSAFIQCFGLLAIYKFLKVSNIAEDDLILQLYFILLIYLCIYFMQLLFHLIFVKYMSGDPMKKFIDLCSWANVSVFILLEPSYGYYIHGRSPHGFADTDMSSMIMQLQRESQSMCGRRGLLCDSDQQTYIILPPINLRTYFQRLLIPFQRSYSISQAHYQKETNSLGIIGGGVGGDGNLERTFIAYSSINRFFCAFIDHAIKDMDYIIKEKTVVERLLNCEFENYLTENKGTFYIDNGCSFSQLFLYGNEVHNFVIELLLLLAIFIRTGNLILSLASVCLFNFLVQRIASSRMRSNVSEKTLIDKRFLL